TIRRLEFRGCNEAQGEGAGGGEALRPEGACPAQCDAQTARAAGVSVRFRGEAAGPWADSHGGGAGVLAGAVSGEPVFAGPAQGVPDQDQEQGSSTLRAQ